MRLTSFQRAGPHVIDISHHAGVTQGRFEARVPESDAIGELTYSLTREGVLVAEHTLVPTALRGRGIGGALVRELIADARERKLRIVPQCSFVKAHFDKHPEWADLLAE